MARPSVRRRSARGSNDASVVSGTTSCKQRIPARFGLRAPLRSAVRDKHATIIFTSTTVQQVDETNFKLTGELTIRGVAKPVNFELTGAESDAWGDFRVGFEGTAMINRKDCGVSWNAAVEGGGAMVGKKVTLQFDVAAIRRPDGCPVVGSPEGRRGDAAIGRVTRGAERRDGRRHAARCGSATEQHVPRRTYLRRAGVQHAALHLQPRPPLLDAPGR